MFCQNRPKAESAVGKDRANIRTTLRDARNAGLLRPGFHPALIGMFRALMGEGSHVTGRQCTQAGMLRKSPGQTLPKAGDTVTEVRDAFEGFLRSLGPAEERISEFGDISMGTSKTEKQRGTEMGVRVGGQDRICGKRHTCV